jgi:hypothetical protein
MGLFQWAKVVCDVIKDDDSDGPAAQLNFIIKNASSLGTVTTSAASLSSPWAALDILYMQVLRQAAAMSGSHVSQLRNFLATIILLQRPLSAVALGRLLGVDAQTIRHRLRKLHSVVDVPSNIESELRIIHPSFADFLTDHTRCTDDDLCVDSMLHHGHIARRCLLRIQCHQGDTCELADARRTVFCILELLSHPKGEKPPIDDLFYVYRFWEIHVSRSSPKNAELHHLIREFMSHNYLHCILGIYSDSFQSPHFRRFWMQKSLIRVVFWALPKVMLTLSIP